MLSIIRFGDYGFDVSRQQTYTDTFRSAIEASHRVYNAQGEIDQFGIGDSPTGKGEITINYIVIGNVIRTLQQLGRLKSAGTARLVSRALNGEEYYLEAKIRNVQYTQDVQNVPHERQLVTITWTAYTPFWLSEPDERIPRWGGVRWGSAIWGGIKLREAIAGAETNFNLNVGGNAATTPIIRVTTAAGESIPNIRIQRLDAAGGILDQVSYSGTIPPTNELTIDCAALTARLMGASVWNSGFDFLRARCFILEGGTGNTIRVLTGSGSSAGLIVFDYKNRWR